MKILLIQPRMNPRPMDTALKMRMAPPLSILTLMRLTPEGHTVTFVNENLDPVDFTAQADLVGITVTLDVLPRACEIAARFRARGVKVVAGGIHITCEPAGCLASFDALCIGAAERVWARILDDAAQNALKKVYYDMEGFSGDEIACPQYDGIDPKKYLYTNVVTTSRGCPNRCDFCYNSAGNRMYVHRPVADVLRDIKAVGTRHVLFIDDNFIGDVRYTRELLESLRGARLAWSAAVTASLIDDPALLELMAETGCRSLFIGFESINNAALRGVHKENRAERYEKLIGMIHDRGIMVNASMVFGLDGDGPRVFDDTLRFLEKNRVETLTSHILTPYPGTALYRRMEAAGRITDFDLSHYNTAHVVFKPAGMSPRQLYDGYLGMYKRFYSFRSIVRRMPRQRAQRKAYLLFNLFYRKFGKCSAALSRVIPLHRLGRFAAKLSYHIGE